MSDNKIIKYLDYALFIGFLVLAAGSTFSIALSTFAVFFLLLIWLIKIFFLGKSKWEKSSLNIIFYAYILTGLISCLVGIDPKHSFYEFRSQYLILVFFLIINNLKAEKQINQIIKYFLIFSVIASFFGLIQYWLGINHLGEKFVNVPTLLKNASPEILRYLSLSDGRVQSTRSHPITFAEGLIFALSLLLSIRMPRWKLILGGIIILGALIFSQSRGAWLGMFGAILTIEVIKRKKFPFWSASLVLFVGLLAFLWRGSTITERARSIFDIKRQASNVTRLEMWQTGVKILTDYPVWGIGPGNVEKLYNKYRPTNPPDSKSWSELHNNFLQIAVERGIIGLAFFLMLIVFYFRILIRKLEHPFVCAALAALVGTLISGLTESNFHDAEIVIIFYLFMGISSVLVGKKT